MRVANYLGIGLLGVFGLCYADGFASSFASATRLGVASAAYQRSPPLDGKAESRQGDSFDVFFWRGMRGERAADANRDGRVSVGEAVDYARGKHTESRTGRQLPMTAGRPDPYRAFLPRM